VIGSRFACFSESSFSMASTSDQGIRDVDAECAAVGRDRNSHIR
jgi:hypothetical protein